LHCMLHVVYVVDMCMHCTHGVSTCATIIANLATLPYRGYCSLPQGKKPHFIPKSFVTAGYWGSLSSHLSVRIVSSAACIRTPPRVASKRRLDARVREQGGLTQMSTVLAQLWRMVLRDYPGRDMVVFEDDAVLADGFREDFIRCAKRRSVQRACGDGFAALAAGLAR
jgi:hypothetical protein